MGSVSPRDLDLFVTNGSPVFTGTLESEILPKGSSFLEHSWRVGDQLCSESSKHISSTKRELELNKSS